MPLLRGRYSGSVARTWRFYIGFRAGYSTTCDIETLSISGHAVTSLTNHTADDRRPSFCPSPSTLHIPIAPPPARLGLPSTHLWYLYCQHHAAATLHCTGTAARMPNGFKLTTQLSCPGDFGGLRRPAQTNVLTHICFLTSRCPRAGKSDNSCKMGGNPLNPPGGSGEKGLGGPATSLGLPKSALGR